MLYSHCDHTARRCFTKPPSRTVTPATSWSIRAGHSQPSGGKKILWSAPWKQILVPCSCLKWKKGGRSKKSNREQCVNKVRPRPQTSGRNNRIFLPSHRREHLSLPPNHFHSTRSILDILYRCHHLERSAVPQGDWAGLTAPPWRRVFPPDAGAFFKCPTVSHFADLWKTVN